MTNSSIFKQKKEDILRQLAVPDDSYDDLSPKGSVDAEIRDFVDEINKYEGLVTTSSCSGRVSVFLEGRKNVARSSDADDEENGRAFASDGGKGGGGRWLFVSHQPVNTSSTFDVFELLGLQQENSSSAGEVNVATARFIHFKFEPMILHILASSWADAQKTLSAAQQAGFRESGLSGVSGPDRPVIVAVRTAGLAFDNVIGALDETSVEGETLRMMVDEACLRLLLSLANEKFKLNVERTKRFQSLLSHAFDERQKKGIDWEDAGVRRERKRMEGLKRREELRQQAAQKSEETTAETYGNDLEK